MAGYTRVDTSNNIADGNVISAADLDNEFDGIQAAFNASTGHNHDGTTGEGAPILVLGPTQDVVVGASTVTPKTTNTVDIGSSSLKFKDLFLAGNASIGGTLAVTGVATLTAQPILSSLTASRAVFTDGSKGLVSNAITGTGNVVMSASPTLTGTITAEALTLSGSVTASGGTANGVAYLNGSKVLTTGSALTFDGTTLGTSNIKSSGVLAIASNTAGNAIDFLHGISPVGRFSGSTTGIFTVGAEGSVGAIGSGYATLGAYGANGGGFRIFRGTGAGTPTAIFYADNTGTFLGSTENTPLSFQINSTEQMRLTSTGLGIGTSSPANKLVVNVGSAATNGLYIYGTGGSNPTLYLGHDASHGTDATITSNGSTGNLEITPRSGYNTYITSGNLGIGTSSPVAPLTVNKGNVTGAGQWASSAIAVANPTNVGAYSQIAFGYTAGTTNASAYIGFVSTNQATNGFGDLVFGTRAVSTDTQPTERMRLDSSGNLTIGGQTATRLEVNLTENDKVELNAVDSTNTARNLVFSTGDTERARIDSSGNVGIGTSSPGTSNTAGISFVPGTASYVSATGSNGSAQLLLGNNNNGSNSAADTTCGLIAFKARFNGTFGGGNDVASIVGTYTGDGTTRSGAIRFLTLNNGAEAERARIDSSGNLLVGTTSNYGGRRLDVRGSNGNYLATLTNSNAASFGWQIYYDTYAPNNTTSDFLTCVDSAAARFNLRSNGGLANYSGNNVNLSDRREKTNFAPAKSYLDTICAIPVQTFNYADQNMEEDPGLTLGVVAQDVQAVAPELVMESNWGTKENPKQRLSIYQTDLQYALMKALQELKAEFDAYKASHP